MAVLFLLIFFLFFAYLVEMVSEKIDSGSALLPYSLTSILFGVLTWIFDFFFDSGAVVMRYGVAPEVVKGEVVFLISLAMTGLGVFGLAVYLLKRIK